MTKIMLVEDDKSLREIYGVRLLAEGYDIVSAGDGEEALAMSIKERPQLIISDVMMPKISGFDLLDILRSTTETRNIRVIMMTALSSEDQRLRGEQLGADRYLVKSQVGIEDVVRVVHEVLGDAPAPVAAPAAPSLQPAPARPIAPPPTAASLFTPAAPVAAPAPVTASPVAPAPSLQPAPILTPSPLPIPSSQPQQIAKPPQARSRVIEPLNDPTVRVNINELLDRELAKEAGIDGTPPPTVPTLEQERSEVNTQISQFQPSSLPQPTPIETIQNSSVNPLRPAPAATPAPVAVPQAAPAPAVVAAPAAAPATAPIVDTHAPVAPPAVAAPAPLPPPPTLPQPGA